MTQEQKIKLFEALYNVNVQMVRLLDICHKKGICTIVDYETKQTAQQAYDETSAKSDGMWEMLKILNVSDEYIRWEKVKFINEFFEN